MSDKQHFVTPLSGGFSSVDPDILGMLDPTKVSKLINFDIQNEQLVKRGGLSSYVTFPTGANNPFGFYVYQSDSGQAWELLFALDSGSTPRVWARGSTSGQSWVQLTTSDAASIPGAKPDITTFAGVCFIAFPGRNLYTFDGGSELNAQITTSDPYGNTCTVPKGQYFAQVGNRLFLFGGPAGRTIYFTEPNTNFWKYLEQPDKDVEGYTDPINVPENHITLQCDGPLTSGAGYGGTLISFTENKPYEITWEDRPDEGQVREIPSNVGSISHWATHIFEGKLMFTWYDGVYSWNGAVVKKESEDLDDYIDTFSKGPLRYRYWGEGNEWLGWSHTNQEVNKDGRLTLEETEQVEQYTSGDDTEHSICLGQHVAQSFKLSYFCHHFTKFEARVHYKLSPVYTSAEIHASLQTRNSAGSIYELWRGKATIKGQAETTEWIEFTETWRCKQWRQNEEITNIPEGVTLFMVLTSFVVLVGTIQFCRWRAHTAGTYANGASSANAAHDQLFKFTYNSYATSGSSDSPPVHAHDAVTWGEFGAFVAREPSGSSVVFKYRYASTEAGLIGGWTTISPGDTLAPGTNKWLQFRVELGRGTGGKTPEVASLMAHWKTGADDPMEICDSWVFEDMYFVNWKNGSDFYALVLDKQKGEERWRIWDWALKEGAVVKGNLIGITDTAVIKYDTTADGDLGTPFDVKVWTAKWSMGNPFVDKGYRSVLLGIEGTEINSLKIETENVDKEFTNLALSGVWLEEGLSPDVVGRSARIKIEGKSDEISKVRVAGLLYRDHALRRR